MSIVRVYVDPPDNLAQVVGVIRRITNASISDIRTQMSGGNPVYEAELFLNDFADVADDLRTLVNELGRINASFRIYEWEHQISPEVLFNILEGSDQYRL